MKVREELNRDEPPSSIDLAPVDKKLSDNNADENEDFKLEAITELETQLEQIQKFEKQRGGEISDSRTAPVTKVTVTKHPVMNRNSNASLVNQIRSHVSALVNLFSSVFEALLIKLEGTEDPPPEINPMMARKAREFEARFQRQIFEGKQKALVMESASLKHKLHRHDERQLGAYLKSLHQGPQVLPIRPHGLHSPPAFHLRFASTHIPATSQGPGGFGQGGLKRSV